MQNAKVSGLIPIFSLSPVCVRRKNSFLCIFTELKIYHLSCSVNKHGAIDIANPSSMQDACQIELRKGPRSP